MVLPDPAQRPLTGIIPVDQTDPCDSGTVRVFGTLSDFGTGTLTVNYQNCRDGDETVNGQGTFRVDVFDMGLFVPTDFTITTSRLTFRGTGISFDNGGTVRIQLNVGARTETITQNMVSLNNLTGATSKSENLVFVNTYNDFFFPTSYTGSLSGRIYHGVHGYVDVSTLTPVAFATLTQAFPHSGQLLLIGNTSRSVRVTAHSSTVAVLALDLDGDGGFESSVTLTWMDLGSSTGADLADTDGDGMHNAWETAKGLNPNDAADAAVDSDGDAFTNLAEYLASTDPKNAGSVPPAGPGPGPNPGPGPTPIAFAGHIVSLPSNSDLVYEPVSGMLYASVRGNPGSVVPINPVTRVLGTPIPVGIDPVKLALSDDGQYLYVGLDGEPKVERINLTTKAVDQSFLLGSAGFGPWFAEDIAVLPGSPQSIAVSLKKKMFSPRHEGVAIYDNGVMRAAKTGDHTGSNVIEFSASSGTLYGYNNETTEYGFRRMAVDAGGVTVTDVYTSFMSPELISGFNVDIHFHGGLIYTTTGRAIDPVARSFLGAYDLPSSFGNSVVADSNVGRVFYLTQGGTASPWNLRAFGLVHPRAVITIVDLTGLVGEPGSLRRWGTNGLAFRTSGGQVFLTQSTALLP